MEAIRETAAACTVFIFVVKIRGRRMKFRYKVLASGPDFDACTRTVLSFFTAYQLVRYSHVTILKEDSLPATHPEFWNEIGKAVNENHLVLKQLIKELGNEGVTSLKDLEELPQGYKSTMLHTVTHFFDGFFGVDTSFYNLEEHSHWISEGLTEKMHASPGHFWFLSLEAQS
jgi:hypothetical protein